MGANKKQGWCLFAFLVGFTFLPAGMVYLGWMFSLLGLACLTGSAVGFYRIKPLEYGGSRGSSATTQMSERREATRPMPAVNLKGGEV
jgi:hypothetical protein